MKEQPNKFRICVVSDTYEDKNGKTKNRWQTIGEISLWKESGIVNLYSIDGTKSGFVFPIKTK